MKRIKAFIVIIGIFLGGTNSFVFEYPYAEEFNYTDLSVVPKNYNLSYEGLYFGDGILACKNVAVCFHELGHMSDEEMEYPSSTYEFVLGVNYYLDNNPCEKSYHDGSLSCMIKYWPGIHGNPFRDEDWGGYSELYASIWSLCMLEGNFPDVLEEFFVIVNP